MGLKKVISSGALRVVPLADSTTLLTAERILSELTTPLLT